MAQHDTHNTYIERERIPVESGGSGFALFIVGGLVVAALVLFWLFAGGTNTDATAPATGGGDVSVTVQDGAPIAGSDGNAAAPADDTTVRDGAAPADGTAPAADAPAAGTSQPQPAPAGN